MTPVDRLLPVGTLRGDVGLEGGSASLSPGVSVRSPAKPKPRPWLRSRLPGSGPHDPGPAPPPPAALRLPDSGCHRARPLAASTGGGVRLRRDGDRRWAPLGIQLVLRSSLLAGAHPDSSGRLEYKTTQCTGVLGPQSRPVPLPDSSSSRGPYKPRRSTLPYAPLSTTARWHPILCASRVSGDFNRQSKASLVSKAAAYPSSGDRNFTSQWKLGIWS